MMNLKWRSLLFVPAHDSRRVAKVASRGADAVILDLEDAVPRDRKAQARQSLPEAIRLVSSQSADVVVRINKDWRESFADLEAAIRPGISAIMAPKVENAGDLRVLSDVAAEIAAEVGLPHPPLFIALIESTAGLQGRSEIAAVPSLTALALGTEDFSLSLGVRPSHSALDLPCRMLALTAATHGLQALGTPISIATIADRSAWAASVDYARAIGMTGALCIHPDQVIVANAAFGPNEKECAWARQVIAAWEANGSSGVIEVGGQMVDLPVVKAAERILGTE